jgi:hypothetical protein
MTSPFKDALRDELRAAAYRDLARVRRRRLGSRIGGAIAAVTAAVAGALTLWPTTAAADIEITIRNGTVEVRIVDLKTDPREVERAMNRVGLEAQVVGLSTGPSAVGRFVQVGLADGDTEQITKSGDDGHSFDGFTVPERYDGQLVIAVGVASKAGRPYDVGTDASAKGEPLACKPVIGRPVRAISTRPGVEVLVSPQGVPTAPIPLSAADPYRAWYVTEALATAEDSVLLVAVSDPVPPEDPPC